MLLVFMLQLFIFKTSCTVTFSIMVIGLDGALMEYGNSSYFVFTVFLYTDYVVVVSLLSF